MSDSDWVDDDTGDWVDDEPSSEQSSGILDAVKKVPETIDRYYDAPQRAFIGAAQEGKNPFSAAWDQVGADPASAPSDQDLARRAGVSDRPIYDVPDEDFERLTWEDPLAARDLSGLRNISRSGAAGFGLSIARDPLNAIPALTAGGKLTRGGMEALEKIAPKLSAVMKEFGYGRAAKAIGGERATIKKLGPDRVKEVGQYALDNKLFGPFSSSETMLSRNEDVMSRAMSERDKAYGLIDAENASTFNPMETAIGVEDKIVGGMNRSYDDTQEIVAALDPHLSNILSRGENNISMREAQDLVESLGRKARFETSRSNLGNDVAVDTYHAAREALNQAAADGAEKISIPGLRELVQNSNKTYSTGLKAKGLLDNKFAREQGNKLLGLTDSIALDAALEATTGGKAAAVVGVKMGAERYGNQIMATGANRLSEMLKAAPEKFGQFAPILQAAEQRGPQGLAATHFVLQQTSAPYRETLQQVADANEGN